MLKPAVCLHNVAAVAPGAGATVSEALGAFQPGAASGRQHGMCMQIDNDHLPRQAWDTHIPKWENLSHKLRRLFLCFAQSCRGHRLPSKPSVASAVATGLRRRGCHTCHPGISIGASRRNALVYLSLAPPFSVRKNPIVCQDGLRTVKHAEILTQALCDLFSSSQGEGRRRVGADTTATWRRGGRATAVDI